MIVRPRLLAVDTVLTQFRCLHSGDGSSPVSIIIAQTLMFREQVGTIAYIGLVYARMSLGALLIISWKADHNSVPRAGVGIHQWNLTLSKIGELGFKVWIEILP